MDEEQDIVKEEDAVITPWFILETILPIVKDEFIAKCRVDRTGIRMAFCNGQKFHLTVNELK